MLMEAFNFHDDEDHNSSSVELEMNELVANNSSSSSSAVPKLYLVMPAEWLDPTLPLPTDKEFHQWISAQRRRHGRTGRSLGRSPSEASFGSAGSRGWSQRMVETSTDLLQRARSGIQRSNSNSNNNNTNLAGMFGNRLGDEGVELLQFE